MPPPPAWWWWWGRAPPAWAECGPWPKPPARWLPPPPPPPLPPTPADRGVVSPPPPPSREADAPRGVAGPARSRSLLALCVRVESERGRGVAGGGVGGVRKRLWEREAGMCAPQKRSTPAAGLAITNKPSPPKGIYRRAPGACEARPRVQNAIPIKKQNTRPSRRIRRRRLYSLVSSTPSLLSLSPLPPSHANSLPMVVPVRFEAAIADRGDARGAAIILLQAQHALQQGQPAGDRGRGSSAPAGAAGEMACGANSPHATRDKNEGE